MGSRFGWGSASSSSDVSVTDGSVALNVASARVQNLTGSRVVTTTAELDLATVAHVATATANTLALRDGFAGCAFGEVSAASVQTDSLAATGQIEANTLVAIEGTSTEGYVQANRFQIFNGPHTATYSFSENTIDSSLPSNGSAYALVANTTTNAGNITSYLTPTHDTVNGTRIQINQTGLYAITFHCVNYDGLGEAFCVSRNVSATTTTDAVEIADVACGSGYAHAIHSSTASVVQLNNADVLRLHCLIRGTGNLRIRLTIAPIFDA